jgi:hypothetical protein
MNSPKLQKYDEFETTVARDLKIWSGRVQSPAGGREALLRKAAERTRRAPRRISMLRSLVPHRLQRWLTSPRDRLPKLPQTELTQWLYTQAMWHNLGNDRRAVRFVC